MAQYISTGYITDKYGARFAFGTAGSCVMTEGQGTRLINSVSNYIDFELQTIYGTMSPLFGTNAYGTTTVPQIVQDIAADITVGWMYDNLHLSVSDRDYDWSRGIWGRGTLLLGQLASGVAVAVPFLGTMTNGNLPAIPNEYGQVYGESITLDGTNTVELDARTVIRRDLIVYGTELTGGTKVYHEGTDFKVLYLGDSHVGTNYGIIYGLTAAVIPCRIDYKYVTSRAFALNDYSKWGEGGQEDRG